MPTQITASQISDLGQSINARTTKYVATKAAGVTLATGLPDGVVVIVEEDESFTPSGVKVRYTVAGGLLISAVTESASSVKHTPYGSGAVATTVEATLRSPTSGLGDYNIENTLHIFCGDSTTEGLQVAGGAADRFKQLRQVGGPLEKVIGMINFGGSGHALAGFVNDAATPGFVGPSIGAEVGILQWDSWLHKPTGAISQATGLAWRAQYPQYRVIWTICYGINDLILYAATGNLSQQGIVDYLVPLLRTAVTRIKAAWPQDQVILRIPNPMTFQPYNAQFPSAAAYPTFDTPGQEATSRALVEKWNQALRQTYYTVQGEFSRCVLMETWENIFGKSDTTLTAATQLPFLGDRVHPSVAGYAATAVQYTRLVVPRYANLPPRKEEADSRALLLANNAWENYPRYFENNTRYKNVLDCSLVGIGSNFIDLAISYAKFQQQVFGPIYIAIEGLAAQYFATYNAGASGANTRLTAVAPSTAMQVGKANFKVGVYQDNTVSLLASDAYVDGQARSAKEAFAGVMNTCGNGFLRISFPGVNGRLSTKFIAGVLNGKLAVGGTIGQVIDFTAGGWIALSVGAAVNRQLQFNKAGVDYTTWTSQPAALFFSDDVPSPKSYEDLVVSGTTDASAGTQSTHAHGLGYVPRRTVLLPKGAGTVYQSAEPDATNIYLKATANSIAFDAYVL